MSTSPFTNEYRHSRMSTSPFTNEYIVIHDDESRLVHIIYVMPEILVSEVHTNEHIVNTHRWGAHEWHLYLWHELRMSASPFMTMNDVSWISFTNHYIDTHEWFTNGHIVVREWIYIEWGLSSTNEYIVVHVLWMSCTNEYMAIHDDDSRLVNIMYEWVHRHSRMVNHTVIYEWVHRNSWRWMTCREYHLRTSATKSSSFTKVIKHWRMAMIVRYSRRSRVRDMSVRESFVCVPTIHLCVC